jgi:uncharacterized protein YcgI (DUF1989 family)
VLNQQGNSASVVVPARQGHAVLVRAGESVDVVDVEGAQVADVWAIDADNHARWLSTSHTRDYLERLFPRVGECFVDQQYEPIMEFVADMSPGLHDMLFPACNPALYDREGLVGHPNCADNFRAVSAAHGVVLPALPDPVNLFQNSAPGPDGKMTVLAARSRPGDGVTLRAVRDVLVAVTACAVDFWPTNGDRCGPLQITVRRTMPAQ